MGYINYSRSQRSYEAIQSYEVPLSLITKEMIEKFINNELNADMVEDAECEMNYEDAKSFLLKLSITEWRRAAKEDGPSSWHHTSCWYNKTNHYSLFDTVNYILENIKYFTKKKKIKDEKEKEFFIKIRGLSWWFSGTTTSYDNFYHVGKKKVRKNLVYEMIEATDEIREEIKQFGGEYPQKEIK